MEDEEYLREQIHNSLNLRETEDLVEIWQTHDSNEWTDLAFEVVKSILQERLGEVPPQDDLIDSEPDISDENLETKEPLSEENVIEQPEKPLICLNCKSTNVLVRDVELRDQMVKVVLKRPEASIGRFFGLDVEFDEIAAIACEDCGHVYFMLKDFI